jgi:hypothetical protein
MKPKFLSWIDLSGIIDFNTFSVVPSIINENANNVLFHWLGILSLAAGGRRIENVQHIHFTVVTYERSKNMSVNYNCKSFTKLASFIPSIFFLSPAHFFFRRCNPKKFPTEGGRRNWKVCREIHLSPPSLSLSRRRHSLQQLDRLFVCKIARAASEKTSTGQFSFSSAPRRAYSFAPLSRPVL